MTPDAPGEALRSETRPEPPVPAAGAEPPRAGLRAEDVRDAFTFFKEIGIIAQLSAARSGRLLPHGLTNAQFSALGNLIRVRNPNTPSALAAAFQVTKGAMTNTLQRLEAAGFVEVTPDPSDGRGKLVAITEAGRRAHEDAVMALAPAISEVSDGLGVDEMRAMTPALERLRRWLDDHR